jgi:hypothetical protein
MNIRSLKTDVTFDEGVIRVKCKPTIPVIRLYRGPRLLDARVRGLQERSQLRSSRSTGGVACLNKQIEVWVYLRNLFTVIGEGIMGCYDR